MVYVKDSSALTDTLYLAYTFKSSLWVAVQYV